MIIALNEYHSDSNRSCNFKMRVMRKKFEKTSTIHCLVPRRLSCDGICVAPHHQSLAFRTRTKVRNEAPEEEAARLT